MINSILALCIFLIFAQTSLGTELVEVGVTESQEFQESAFIKLMNNFNDGKIPYPFSNLLDSFGTGVREEGNILFVPEGRSLVKEYADFHNPRIIVEPIGKEVSDNRVSSKKDTKPSVIKTREENRRKISELGIMKGDLYIGFAPNHKALEIISYNPKKARYDFFVIQDYESGKKPKIISNPAQCLSCHQNEGPLFPKGPWHELAGKTADSDTDEGDKNVELMNRIRIANPKREDIEGISLEKKNKDRFSFFQIVQFDQTVRDSNVQSFKNEVCNALCPDKNNIDCQKNLLQVSLSKNGDFNSYPYFKNIEEQINAISLKSSVIPDRIPETNEGFRNIIPPGLDRKGKGYDSTFLEINLAAKDKKVQDDNFVNPATPRPINSNVEELQDNIKMAKTLNEKINLAVDSCLPIESLKKSLKDNNSSIDELLNLPQVIASLKEWPNTRNTVALISSESQKFRQLNVSVDCVNSPLPSVIPVYTYSKLEAAVEKFNNDKVKKPEALFGKYCMQCHGGKDAFIPLPLDSAEKMANYVPHFGKTGIEERLIKKIMPPPLAALQPSEEERAQMVKLLQELKK